MGRLETWLLVSIKRMEGRPDRPQQVLDFIDMVWKFIYGEVLR